MFKFGRGSYMTSTTLIKMAGVFLDPSSSSGLYLTAVSAAALPRFTQQVVDLSRVSQVSDTSQAILEPLWEFRNSMPSAMLDGLADAQGNHSVIVAWLDFCPMNPEPT